MAPVEPRSRPSDPGERARFLDGLFSAVADRRRRSILRHLDGRDVPIALADLARDLAAEAPESSPDEGRPERVLIGLHHVHVPRLAAVNVVDFDDSERTVERGSNFGVATRLLAPVEEREVGR